jgi:hypothetical protein
VGLKSLKSLNLTNVYPNNNKNNKNNNKNNKVKSKPLELRSRVKSVQITVVGQSGRLFLVYCVASVQTSVSISVLKMQIPGPV